MIRKPLVVAVLSAVAAGAACVTINVYFPAAAIKDLSKQIEEEVRKEAIKQGSQPGDVEPAEGQPATPPPAQPAPPPGASSGSGEEQPAATFAPASGGSGIVSSLFGITPAFAQGVPPPEISNPAIRKIIESRGSRVAQLNGYKSKGVIGENNTGLLDTRSLDSLTDLKDRAEVQRLVKAENADREELYQEIATAKKVAASDMPKIRETYASTLREQARPGDWIQMPDGSWKQK